MEKEVGIYIKFNGKNYMAWTFHFCHCVAGKGLAGYLDGTVSVATDDKKQLAWNQNN